MRVPEAIAGTFECDARRQRDDLPDQTALAQYIEHRCKDRLLALSLRMAEAREQRLAVEHHSAVGGEDEIGQAVLRVDQFDAGAAGAQSAEQAVPLPHGGGVQHFAALVPSGRIHPGIDAVSDGEVSRPAHQETRPRIKLLWCGHPLPRTFSCLTLRKRLNRRSAMPKIWIRGVDATVEAGNST